LRAARWQTNRALLFVILLIGVAWIKKDVDQHFTKRGRAA
jgi:hypothetical protein